MKRAAVCILVVTAITVLAGCSGSPSTVSADKPKADNKQAYITLVKHLSDGWTTDRNTPKPQQDLTQILAEAQNMILDFNAIKTDDTDLVTIRDEAKAGVQQVADALRTLDQLPKPPGSGELFLASFAYGFVLRPDLAIELGDKAQNQANAIQDQVRRLIAGIQRAEAAKLLLRRAMPKYAGPSFNSPSAVTVDIDEAFGSDSDWVALTNSTGRDLHNAVVSVTLLGKRAETKENIHFIALWRTGQTIQCRYEGGTVVGDKAVARQTVYLIQSAKINLAADEGRQDDIFYQYAGPEKDKDVQRYLNSITNMYAQGRRI